MLIGDSAPNTLLLEFERELRELIGSPTRLRPFVCNGSPLKCQIFLVGFNPANEMAQSFWNFWQTGYGFMKQEWLAAYKRERQLKQPEGKKRRSTVSNTRRVMEWIAESALPAKCLETNIYARPTARVRQLDEAYRDTRPFDFLLEKIQPKVIVTHGKSAARHIELVLGAAFPENELAQVDTRMGKTWGVAVPHFSRGWSEERARALGRKLREVVGNWQVS